MIVYVVHFEDLEYFVAWLDVVERLEFVHNAEPAALLLLVAHFSVGGLRHMAIEVYRTRASPVDPVGVGHFYSKSFGYCKLFDLRHKVISHVQLHLLPFVPAGHYLWLLCLFKVQL